MFFPNAKGLALKRARRQASLTCQCWESNPCLVRWMWRKLYRSAGLRFGFLFLATPHGIVPCSGIEPTYPVLKAWSLNHWTTREVPAGLLSADSVVGGSPTRLLLAEPLRPVSSHCQCLSAPLVSPWAGERGQVSHLHGGKVTLAESFLHRTSWIQAGASSWDTVGRQQLGKPRHQAHAHSGFS